MPQYFSIVLESDPPGVISAYVVGLPVYAQGPTMATAERAIRKTLAAYLEANPETVPPTAGIRVAAVDRSPRHRTPRIAIRSAAALIGASTSRRKAATSRANGLLGGRPRKTASAR